MNPGGFARPKIRAEDYGLPMRCPKPECGFGWLKLPGVKMIACPNCGSVLVSTRKKTKGQAITEFALVMPIFLFLVLGGGELAFLVASQFNYQRGADLLADVAAEKIGNNVNDWHDKWIVIARSEDTARHCGDPHPILEFPDGDTRPGDRVRVIWQCFYKPRITTMWDGLSIEVVGESVIHHAAIPDPTPTVSAEPSG